MSQNGGKITGDWLWEGLEEEPLVALLRPYRKLCGFDGRVKSKRKGVGPVKLVLTHKQMEEIIAHAFRESPLEACGLLAGKEGKVEKVYPLPNAEKSPFRYRADPEAQFRAMQEIEEMGWEIVGIYHSHPSSPPYPSAVDIEMAYYSEAAYLIVSLSDPHKPLVKAFSLASGKPEEVEIEVRG